MREQVQRLEDCGPLRVQYLLKRLSEEELEKQVFAQDAKRRKTLQVLHVMELLSAVLTETFNDMNNFCQRFTYARSRVNDEGYDAWVIQVLARAETLVEPLKAQCKLTLSGRGGNHTCDSRSYFCTAVIADSMDRMGRVIDYCNAQFAQISVAFSLSVPKLICRGNKWRWSSECATLEKLNWEERTRPRHYGRVGWEGGTTLYNVINCKYSGAEAAEAQRVSDAIGEAPAENVKI